MSKKIQLIDTMPLELNKTLIYSIYEIFQTLGNTGH